MEELINFKEILFGKYSEQKYKITKAETAHTY